uniref:Tubby C-terminal domain-containing protein n=1 Tax=Oryza glaberrima TaxID=4538 RepID=I1NXV3_ORYGL
MAATKREPLRPISTNAGTVERRARGGAAAAAAAKEKEKEKENEVPTEIGRGKDGGEKKPPVVVAVVVPPAPPLKPSSLQVRMKAEEEKEREEEEEGSSPAVALVAGLQVRMGPRGRELLLPPPPPPPPLPLPTSSSYEAWDLSDNEAAPASSWATLPNRALLCRPLPLDVGRCTCIIAKETLAAAAAGARGVALYSLYTNEGQGRQDRKLAVARHRRRRGRSEFVVAQNLDGIFCTSDKNFLGTLSSNLVGSRYRIWGQGNRVDEIKSQSKRLLGVVAFAPTVTTLTGSFRSMRAWIPKNQSIHLKNSNSAQQIQHISGLPKDWQEKKIKADQLCSRSPFYNNMTKRYELDFRERAGRMGYKVQPSVKNFQMTLEENGRQTILQLGRIGKSKYIMDFRYPLTGYQALCICLASIDSKLCCTL